MPSLVPIEEPYSDEVKAGLLHDLKTKGFCVLPDVWERDSVTQYEKNIRALAGPGARYSVHATEIPEERQADSWWLPNDCPEVSLSLSPRARALSRSLSYFGCLVHYAVRGAHPRVAHPLDAAARADPLAAAAE